MKQRKYNRARPHTPPQPRIRILRETPFKQHIRQIATAAILMAVLILICCLYAASAQLAPATGGIIISEVVSSNRASLVDDTCDSPDWIELYNGSDSSVNLTGFSIGTNLEGERHPFGAVIIPAGGYAVIYAEVSDSAASTGFTLPRKGETLSLFDPSGNVLESLSVPALFTDISYARRPNGCFGYCLCPTPGAANDTQIESLKYCESCAHAEKLVVTEVMPSPSTGDAWIELYNAGNTKAFLGLFFLADAADAPLFHLPDITLGAGEYTIVYAGGAKDDLHIPLSFDAGDHGAYLFDITGTLRSALTWEISPGKDTAVIAANTYTTTATPGTANSTDVFTFPQFTAMDDTDPIRISELLVSNTYSIADSDGEHGAWAEVCNVSKKAVSLSGYCLSDDPTAPFKWAFPDTVLEPGGYAVVFLSGKSNQSEMHASFRLSADEDALYLTDSASMRTDTYMPPAAQAENVSVGRADGGCCYYAYPSPGSANAEGFLSIAEALQSRAKGVYISEVCAAGDEEDWVELFNGSGSSVNLTGWYLSDDTDDPLRWQIPSVTIKAGGYAVIETGGASDKDAPFAIATSGETVVLTNADGAMVDAMETGVLRPGLTSGRAAGDDTLSRVFFTTPTRGMRNSNEAASCFAAAPTFSEAALYHTSPFTLSLSTATENAVIYYTLNGSVPNESDMRYTVPITISDSTIVRAVACCADTIVSDVSTETYLFEPPHTIPVVCLSGEPSEMNIVFEEATRNYKPMYGGSVEYYETNGTLGVCFTAGIKPKGRSSLDLGQNSVTIKLRDQYGKDEITYPFFEDSSVSTFTEITLRNSGEDWTRSRLRDSFVHKLAENMNIATIHTRLVAVYMNGRYWGLYDLTEEQEEGYFEAYFGLGDVGIDLVDRNATVMEGDDDTYQEARRFAKNQNLSDDAVFAEFAKLVDVDVCTDYLVLNTFFGNGDVINQRFWRARDGSVRWQPLLFDLDWCLRFNDSSRQTFTRYFSKDGAVAVNDTVTNMDIFYGLKQNAAWCDQFIDRYIELAYSNFDTDRMLALFDETIKQMEPEMVRQIARWKTHSSIDAWLEQTDGMREALSVRRDIVFEQLEEAFGLSHAELQARIEAYTSTH